MLTVLIAVLVCVALLAIRVLRGPEPNPVFVGAALIVLLTQMTLLCLHAEFVESRTVLVVVADTTITAGQPLTADHLELASIPLADADDAIATLEDAGDLTAIATITAGAPITTSNAHALTATAIPRRWLATPPPPHLQPGDAVRVLIAPSAEGTDPVIITHAFVATNSRRALSVSLSDTDLTDLLGAVGDATTIIERTTT